MWSFSRNKKSVPGPEIRCGDIKITWDSDDHQWEFSVGDIDYSLSENPVFNLSLLSQLDAVVEWLQTLDAEIDSEIKKHLDGRFDWKEQKELLGIDVSWLIDKNEVEVSYVHDDWGDFGIFVFIANGKITNSDSGD